MRTCTRSVGAEGHGSGSATTVSASLGLSPSLESLKLVDEERRVCELCFVGVLIDYVAVLLDQAWTMSTSCSAAPTCTISGAGRRLCGVNGLPPTWCVCAAVSTESHSSAHGKMCGQAVSLCASVDNSARMNASKQRLRRAGEASLQSTHVVNVARLRKPKRASNSRLVALPCLCQVCASAQQRTKGCLLGRST